jgi:hypothetical protein
MPHARFADLLCPWPGCAFQIWFIDFRLELADRALYDQGVTAWESGAGLIGKCPGCGRSVRFRMDGKACIDQHNEPPGALRLPDDWFRRAVLLDQDGNVIDL